MSKYVTIISLLFSISAQASDSWDICYDAEQEVTIENGTLYVGAIGEIAEESVSVKEISVDSHIEETCVLNNFKERVISLDQKMTTIEVTYVLEENTAPITTTMTCEYGGSGIPASDTCDESTVVTRNLLSKPEAPKATKQPKRGRLLFEVTNN